MLRKVSLLALTVSVIAHGLLLKAADGSLAVAPRSSMPEMALVEVIIPPDEPVQVVTAAPEPAPVQPKPQVKPQPKPAAEPRPEPKAEPVPALPVDPSAATDAGPLEREAIELPSELSSEVELAALGRPEPGAAPQPVAEPGPPAAEAEAPAELVETAAPAEPAVDPRALDLSSWPASGSILFRVSHGESGFQLGEAEHRWWHDGERYEMETVVQTTGLTALLKRFHYVQRSAGGLGKAGLRPERFSVDQEGKKAEWASFDWDAGTVTIQRRKRTRTAPIQPGDQDVLSLWHQIGIVGAEGLPLELTVVSNKAATPSRLSALGVETAALPIGRLDTLHLNAQAKDGSLVIDIWLARRYGMLPVRIRVTDDKGEVFDQQAVRLRLAPPPGQSGGEPAGTQIVELREQVDPFTLYK